MCHILAFIFVLFVIFNTFDAIKLEEFDKEILFNRKYNIILNDGNQTSDINMINTNNTNYSVVDLQKLIRLHENLHFLQINNYDTFFSNNELNLNFLCTYKNNLFEKVKIINFSKNSLKTLSNSSDNSCLFRSLKYLDLSHNNLTTLMEEQFKVFEIRDDIQNITTITVEILKLDHNEINFIKSSTFKLFLKLKFLDLSFNNLKYIHPLSLGLSLELLDLSANYIEDVYEENYRNLKYFYLDSVNLKLNCSCSLNNLLEKYKLNEIYIDDFKCKLNDRLINFKLIDKLDLDSECNKSNFNLSYKIEKKLQKSSVYSYLAFLAYRWFTWYVWKEDTITDVLPKIPLLINNFDQNATERKLNLTAQRLTTINITCEITESLKSNSVIVWKTPFGYFMRNPNSVIFHKMSNLTKIYNYLRFNTGPHPISGANSINEIYVSNNDELIVTSIRQRYTGGYTCIGVNSLNYDLITFNVNVRVGVSDYFLYCLAVSVISSIIPSIIGIILCIICEKQALDSFPMTPPVFPTPLDTLPTTPPNFDFNQWMSNTASNIQGTLDQASKKLRKGFEKASTTVKSIGVTSTAYFYSVYEQGTQRLHTIKSYRLPTLPTVSLPTMKYSNQLATRMGRFRTGVADVFLQFREFCGTSDLTHTASIATIESDTNASSAVGFIVGKIPRMDTSMNYIAEEVNVNEMNEFQSEPENANVRVNLATNMNIQDSDEITKVDD